jgi:ribonucleotide reductase beta subunit family protein with ferritin-like domain
MSTSVLPRIFRARKQIKPYEYPEVVEFAKPIRDAFWTVDHFNFTKDIQDYQVTLSNLERSAIKRTLLAISQIEVKVKEFWGDIYKKFPKSEFDIVGSTFAECFIEGTEVLTPSGWLDIGLVNTGDDVVQYSPNGFSITHVKQKVWKPYKGDVIEFSKSSTTSVVTPNHRMVYFDKSGSYLECLAKDFSIKNTNHFLPEAAAILTDGSTSLSAMERLRIAIQADGSRRYFNGRPRLGSGSGAEYDIRVKKERKIKRLDWILESAGVDFTKTPMSRSGYYCYTIRIDPENDYKEFDWVNLYGKSSEWCRDFINELAEWDGNRTSTKNCKIKFSTSNESAANIAQMVGVAAGYRTLLSTYPDLREDHYKDRHIVSFTENKDRVTVPPLKKRIVPYEGMVGCITVESGAVITRLNGKTFISGNCEVRHMETYSHLLELLHLNDEFDKILEVPAIAARVDYISEAMQYSASPENSRYVLTLALFSLFVENVSLFSQFAIIKSFSKERNTLRAVDNAVQATQKEELVHGMFGTYLINLIREEVPEWFDDSFYKIVEEACLKSYRTETEIIDWIFEEGELDFLPKTVLHSFLKNRFNESVVGIGGKPVFNDVGDLSSLKWFDEEIKAAVHVDFFAKKSPNYAKVEVSADDLF